MGGIKSNRLLELLLTSQPSQPLPRIINLSDTCISVLPEGEELLVLLEGLTFLLSSHLKILPLVLDSLYELFKARLAVDFYLYVTLVSYLPSPTCNKIQLDKSSKKPGVNSLKGFRVSVKK